MFVYNNHATDGHRESDIQVTGNSSVCCAVYTSQAVSTVLYSSVFMSYQCTPLQRYCLCVSCGTLWNQAILMLATMVNWRL